MATEDEEFLTVRIAGDSRTTERLLLVGRAREGRVRVREWTTDTLNTAGREYECTASDLLGDFDQARRDNRSLGVEWYRVERWLDA